jgi:hypothetical protein
MDGDRISICLCYSIDIQGDQKEDPQDGETDGYGADAEQADELVP